LDQPVFEAADREAVQAALEKSLPRLLQHFPLWAVTNLAAGSRFPLLPGLFELAVLDEASQCDIPSAIPILFRAKRVGVVGDPHQLSHATKLSRTRDALLRKRHGLVELPEQRFSYPDTSLYDLFAQTNNVHPLFLKETYRSVESIADYSNQNFYGGRLRVVTMAERLKIPKGVRPGIHWTDVVSPIHSGGPSGCFAPEEVEVVMQLVRALLLEQQFEGTVGVVTPFRQQANRLNDRLYQEIAPAARRASHLIVDTAHGFQGDERDVMVMSLCAGPDMPSGSRGFLRETANLMNVAVSRARAVLHVVGNRSWAARSGIPHLERLATPSQGSSHQKNPCRSPWYPHESPWEKVLFDALKARGVEPEPQYPTLGRRLDLALVRKGESGLKIDLEVDGDQFHRNPDGSRRRDDIWRDIQLQGAGWKVMRFWVYQLREDLDGCVKKILKMWGTL
jgi:very-short-patch-repair endonuclease